MTARPNHEPLPPGLYTTKLARNNVHQPWHVWIPEDGGQPTLCRKLTAELFESLREGLELVPPDESVRPPLTLMKSTTTVDDVDALLAEAGTVPEPSADLLLWRFAQGGYEDLHDTPEGAFDAWHRHLEWRAGPGRRIVCCDCDTVFVRDRKNGQRCTNCRVTYKRTCVDCGEAFAALHHAFKRCPPCREVWLKR